MVTIAIEYQGGLRCQATHQPSGARLLTDAPSDNHGRGASFSPTDLLATALGSCMATIMAIAAERHDVDLSGSTVTVEKRMVADPHRRIGELRTEIHIPKRPDTAVRRLLERAAQACPVQQSLHPDVACPVSFRWGS